MIFLRSSYLPFVRRDRFADLSRRDGVREKRDFPLRTLIAIS